jgi:glycerol-3-phosphate cytidylyltransferase
MKKVITYGTFDLLHHGHIHLLRRARALGDHLTVALSTDEFNAGKGKSCFHPYADRAAVLEAIRFVDTVIPETDWDQKLVDVQQRQIDVFVIGDDWAGHFDFLKPHCQVIYLARTPGISTTHIKNTLKDR